MDILPPHNKYTNIETTNPVKKIFGIADKRLIVLDADLASRYSMTEDSWIEQIPTEDGILLRRKTEA